MLPTPAKNCRRRERVISENRQESAEQEFKDNDSDKTVFDLSFNVAGHRKSLLSMLSLERADERLTADARTRGRTWSVLARQTAPGCTCMNFKRQAGQPLSSENFIAYLVAASICNFAFASFTSSAVSSQSHYSLALCGNCLRVKKRYISPHGEHEKTTTSSARVLRVQAFRSRGGNSHTVSAGACGSDRTGRKSIRRATGAYSPFCSV
jgi:hypothetical protein